jgi:hypothetical protein
MLSEIITWRNADSTAIPLRPFHELLNAYISCYADN